MQQSKSLRARQKADCRAPAAQIDHVQNGREKKRRDKQELHAIRNQPHLLITKVEQDVQRMQNVGNGNVSVSTTDWFVRVALLARAKKATTLSLDGVQLENGEQRWKIAGDAQRLGHGASNPIELNASTSQKIIVYFELTDADSSKGLKIVLTAPGSRVELPLQ